MPVAETHAVAVTIEDKEESSEVLTIMCSKSKSTSNEQTPAKQPQPTPSKEETYPQKSTDREKQLMYLDDKKTATFTYESKAASPEMTQHIYRTILDMVIPNLTVADLLAISPELYQEAIEHCHMQRVPAPSSVLSVALTNSSPPHVKHVTPLREFKVTLNGIHSELGLLNKGSEIVIIHEDTWRKTQAPQNQQIEMRMQTANGGAQDMGGCMEMLEIDIDSIKTWAHAYVVPNAPYQLLLGRPWQCLVRLSKEETNDRVVVIICDPLNVGNIRTCYITPRLWPQGSFLVTTAAFCISSSITYDEIATASDILSTVLPHQPTHHSIHNLTASTLAEHLLQNCLDYDPIRYVFVYKKVANKTKPVATTMPAHAHIVRQIPEDPLLTFLTLSPSPPDFVPGK